MHGIVKVCGITNVDDAQLAAAAGADLLGCIVNHPASPRSVSPTTVADIAAAVPIGVVAVMVNPKPAEAAGVLAVCGAALLQLHGDERPDDIAAICALAPEIRVWKTLPLGPADAQAAWVENARKCLDAGAEAVLVDARTRAAGKTVYGGTGVTVDWKRAGQWAAAAGVPLIIAGGITAENVATAVATTGAIGVDASSSLECAPGRKDAARVQAYVTAALTAFGRSG